MTCTLFMLILKGNKNEKGKKDSKKDGKVASSTGLVLKRFQFPPTDPIEKHYAISDVVLGTYDRLMWNFF